MAVKGRIQEKGRTVEPDQAEVAEPPHGSFDGFLVADLPAHFGHCAVMGMAGQHEGEDRPLRALVFARLAPNTLCLPAPGGRPLARRARR